MAERVETVRLIANVSNYIAGMEQSAAATRALSKDGKASVEQTGKAFTELGHTMLAIGGIAALAVGLAVKQFAEFDAKMSQVQSLSHASAGDMKLLSDAALTAGQKIGFTATEVADAQIELVKAGISVKDILGGALPGALTLAAAGQIDVAQSTEIATIAMTQFSLKGKDIPHVADLLAAGADKALGSVGDLGEALKSGGLVASQFGVSLDETVGTLSAFANAGLLGETAGTDLRQMLLKLADPSAQSATLMKTLGINIYDTSGKFVGLSGLSGQLHDKLSGLSEAQRNQALSTIFGSRAIAGANVLYKEGAKGIADWTSAVNDNGFAQQQATGKMDNLLGDLKKLEAAFQTGIIDAGSGANDTLRSLTKGLTGFVTMASSIPQPVLSIGLGLTALVAVVGLTGGAFLTAVPKIAAFKAAMATMNLTARGSVASIGAISGALVIAGAALVAYAGYQADQTAGAADFKDTLDATTGALTKYSRALVIKKLNETGAFGNAKAAGISQKELTDAVLQGGAALDAVNAKLTAKNNIIDFFNGSGIAAGNASDAIGDVRGQLVQSQKDFANAASAADDAGTATQTVATGLSDVSAGAQDASGAITSLSDQLRNFGKASLDARSAHRAFEGAIDDATAAVKKNGKTLDDHTQKGRDNAAALDAIAQKANEAAAAIFDQTGSQDDANKVLDEGRAALVKTAIQMGKTKKQAQDLADAILATPSEVSTSVKLTGVAAAQAALKEFINHYNGQHIRINLDGTLTTPSGKTAFSDGGYTGGSDPRQPAGIVHAKEFVSTAATTANPDNRRALEFMHAGGTIKGYATGGYVTPTYVQSQPSFTGGQPRVIQPIVNLYNPVARDLASVTTQASQTVLTVMGS